MPERLESPWALKAATAFVVVLALGIAVSGNRSVFSLVILSWSTLASAFAPLLTLYALRRRIPQWGAILSMVVGVSVALYWRHLGWNADIFEGMPGILSGLAIAWALSRPAEEHETKAELDGATPEPAPSESR
jgi:SSS family solute:Na+ symporter/sodium/proline symporter